MYNKIPSLIYILYPTIIGFTGRFLAKLQNLFLKLEIGTIQFYVLKYICLAVLACVLLCLILVIQWKLRDYKYYKWVVTFLYSWCCHCKYCMLQI